MEKFFVAHPAASGIQPDSYKSVEDEKINAFETIGGGTTTSSADFRLLSACTRARGGMAPQMKPTDGRAKVC